MREVRRLYVAYVLALNGGSRSATARAIGVSRSTAQHYANGRR